MHRRTFVTSALSTLAFPAIAAQAPASGRGFIVRSGEDSQGRERVAAGRYRAQMKVSTRDSAGAFLMTEASDIPRGGFVPRHVHFEQDEWFYAIKGEFVVAVGGEMFQLHAGDLVFAPRNVSHTWARVGDTPNTLLVGLFPVLKFERFLERLGALSKPLEGEALEKLYADHGMKIVGPPLDVR